jgi:quinol monooxygenase YgiN
MARIIFEINYDIAPEKRDEYLSVIKELQEHIRSNSNKNYLVVEDKGRKNNFTEMYICESESEYENLEDNTDDKTFELTNKLFSEFVVDKKAKYSTYYEIE